MIWVDVGLIGLDREWIYIKCWFIRLDSNLMLVDGRLIWFDGRFHGAWFWSTRKWLMIRIQSMGFKCLFWFNGSFILLRLNCGFQLDNDGRESMGFSLTWQRLNFDRRNLILLEDDFIWPLVLSRRRVCLGWSGLQLAQMRINFVDGMIRADGRVHGYLVWLDGGSIFVNSGLIRLDGRIIRFFCLVSI